MLTAYIESIIEDTARVLIGDEAVAIAIPLRALPPGARQGMVLRVHFSIDSAATNARARKPVFERYFEE